MKVLVCGSRDWPDYHAIRKRLAKLPRGTTIIHGGCRGADVSAGIVARALGFGEQVYLPDWRGRGKRAGFERNVLMLDQKPDLVLAFQLNGSTGTQHTVDEARKRGIPTETTELWIRGGVLSTTRPEESPTPKATQEGVSGGGR